MSSVDFTTIKQTYPVLDVATGMLGLALSKVGEGFKGDCPVCKAKKSLTVTPGKGWYCFGRCKTGGDQIKLVKLIRGVELRDAALMIQEHFNGSPAPKDDRALQLERVLERLQPEHELIQAMGISADTARAFESGYNATGKLQKRYCVAIRDLQGILIAFAGLALDEEPIEFVNFDPTKAMLNQHRLAGELTLYRTTLDAILAVEFGAPFESVTSFLTTQVSPSQLEYLAGLMKHHQIESLLL
jgi:DNA primase